MARSPRVAVLGALAVGATVTGATVWASAPPPPPSSTVPPTLITIAGPTTTGAADPASTVAYPTVPPFTAPTTTVAADPGSTTTTTVVSPAAGTLITLVELGPEEQAVVDALWEARVLAVEALMDPDAPGLEARLDATYARSGQARGVLENIMQELRDRHLRVYLNAETPWSMTVESLTFYIEPYPNVDVQVCWVDPSILYEPGGAPDGSDVIIDDDVVATRAIYTLVPEDGRWQLWNAQRIAEAEHGVAECPPN